MGLPESCVCLWVCVCFFCVSASMCVLGNKSNKPKLRGKAICTCIKVNSRYRDVAHEENGILLQLYGAFLKSNSGLPKPPTP